MKNSNTGLYLTTIVLVFPLIFLTFPKDQVSAQSRFNNDTNDDLAVVNSGSNNVSILLGNGDGTFSAPVNYTTGSSPISIEVGDFNNDSNLDLAVANFGGFFSGTVSILSGNGSGGFSFPKSLRTSTQPAFVKSGLLNNDYFLDLIVANFGANTVSVYHGDGANNFLLVQTISVPNGPVGLELADITQDGIKDLIVLRRRRQSRCRRVPQR